MPCMHSKGLLSSQGKRKAMGGHEKVVKSFVRENVTYKCTEEKNVAHSRTAIAQ